MQKLALTPVRLVLLLCICTLLLTYAIDHLLLRSANLRIVLYELNQKRQTQSSPTLGVMMVQLELPH